MHVRPTRLAFCLATALLPAWAAAGTQQGATTSKAETEQHVASKNAEVQRLQHDVASQEARTEQADQKMEEQDRAIADLRRQLQELKSAKAAPGQSH